MPAQPQPSDQQTAQLIDLANAAFAEGRYEDAAAVFADIVELRPLEAFHFNSLAVCLANLGLLEEAEKHLRTALNLNPFAPVFHFNLSRICLGQGKTELANKHQEFYREYSGRICPYFGDRLRDRIEAVPLVPPPSPQKFDELLAQGYRRKVDDLSRVICNSCRRCVQNRIRLQEFVPSESQKRVLKRARGVFEVAILRAEQFDDEMGELYSAYLEERHNWPHGDYSTTARQVHTAWPESMQIQWRLQGRLVAVGVFDVGLHGLYASEFYFDKAVSAYSPGILNILTTIEYGRAAGKTWLYMGEYINGKPGMEYKKAFWPQEILDQGLWRLRTPQD